jgi:hypothetical protein
MPSRRFNAPSPPSPRDTIKLGRKTYKLGDRLPLSPQIIRIGPLGGRETVTFQLPDGTRHTLAAELLDSGD